MNNLSITNILTCFNVLTLQFLERLFDDLVNQSMSAEAIKCALLGEHTKLYEVVVSQLTTQAQVKFIPFFNPMINKRHPFGVFFICLLWTFTFIA